MRAMRARSNPVTTNEKIAIGVGLALGVGGLIFLFTRPSAAAVNGGGAKQGGGMVDKNGKPISVDNLPASPPATPPPVVPPPPPPPSAHPLLDAAVAALKQVDALGGNSLTDQQLAAWKQAWNDAYNAMSAALRGGELGSSGQVFNDATAALATADSKRDDWVVAQQELDAANHGDGQVSVAQANLAIVQAALDQARSAAYAAMVVAVQAQTITPDQFAQAFQDLGLQ